MDFNESSWCEFPAIEICTVRISGYGNLHLPWSPLSGPVEGPPVYPEASRKEIRVAEALFD